VTRFPTRGVAASPVPTEIRTVIPELRLAARGTTLANPEVVSIVGLVFQYRTLLGKCELGTGLDFDEIDELSGLESQFRAGEGRKFHREPVVIGALLRGIDINDRVAVHDVSPGGAMVSGAPYTSEGDVVEVVIDADQVSYRFKAIVQWVRDDGDDYQVGLAFIGLPVRLSYGPASDAVAESIVHRIAA
jgi:hypothetical protein